MKPIQFSTSRYSELNSARVQLWVAKHMLGQCNTYDYSRKVWMSALNRNRANLIRIAKRVRAELAGDKA